MLGAGKDGLLRRCQKRGFWASTLLADRKGRSAFAVRGGHPMVIVDLISTDLS